MATLKLFLNDSTEVTANIRDMRIPDLYGLNFEPPHTIESFVILAHRLTGIPVKDLEDARPDSFFRMTQILATYVEKFTRRVNLGVVPNE